MATTNSGGNEMLTALKSAKHEVEHGSIDFPRDAAPLHLAPPPSPAILGPTAGSQRCQGWPWGLADVWGTFVVVDLMSAEGAGEADWRENLLQGHAAVRAHVSGYGGQEMGSRGKGFLFLFAEPRQALRCVVDLQRDFSDMALGNRPTPRVSAAVHVGDAVRDARELAGRDVEHAELLGEAATPGELLVSERLHAILGSAVPRFGTSREIAAGATTMTGYSIPWGSAAATQL